MDRAVSEWHRHARSLTDESAAAFSKKLVKSYTIYGCMLLLPPIALEGHGLATTDLTDLYRSICKHLKITHIAANKPIPLHILPQDEGSRHETTENILRSPTNFTPLYNSFGPPTASCPPTLSDFDSAFWVTAKQNGIFQVWAPRWTMFSRGNISEKARLLSLPSILRAVEEGNCAAVDLYAGIGYFAFSYAKAGVSKVLCWDLNGWSLEGLRRGARANRWEIGVFRETEEAVAKGSDSRLLVFHESNEFAPERIEAMRASLPPVRHVNCGMLPSSRASLEIAARVLDDHFVGWAHVHENFLIEEIGKRAEATRQEFEEVLKRLRGKEVRTEIEFVNRLKSYAPGVMHCVLDIVVYATASPWRSDFGTLKIFKQLFTRSTTLRSASQIISNRMVVSFIPARRNVCIMNSSGTWAECSPQ